MSRKAAHKTRRRNFRSVNPANSTTARSAETPAKSKNSDRCDSRARRDTDRSRETSDSTRRSFGDRQTARSRSATDDDRRTRAAAGKQRISAPRYAADAPDDYAENAQQTARTDAETRTLSARPPRRIRRKRRRRMKKTAKVFSK